MPMSGSPKPKNVKPNTDMTITTVTKMGMELEQWRHESCVAHFGVGDDWATLYDIQTPEVDRRNGYATELLKGAKQHYEAQGKTFGGSVALNDGMRRIYQKLGIKEYD